MYSIFKHEYLRYLQYITSKVSTYCWDKKTSNAHNMRINILIAILLLSGKLFSQINAGDQGDNTFHVFEGGISAGFNFSQVDGDNYAGFNKIGINAGPIVHVNFTPNWNLSLEVLYSQKGSRTKPDPNNFNTYNLSMDYIEIPVLANYNDKSRLIFQAGLAYGRLFSVKEVINGIENNNNEAFYNYELSYIFGGTFLLGEQKHWGVNARYQGSITAVGASANPNVVGLANRLLTLRGVYYF